MQTTICASVIESGVGDVNYANCQQQAKFVIKAEFNGDLRRVTLNTLEYSDLTQRVSELFPVFSSSPVSLKYKDEDGDLITFTTNDELKDAFETAHAKGALLRVIVVVKQPLTAVCGTTSEEKAVAPSASAPCDPASVCAVPVQKTWRELKSELCEKKRALCKHWREAKMSGEASEEELKALKMEVQNARQQLHKFRQEKGAHCGSRNGDRKCHNKRSRKNRLPQTYSASSSSSESEDNKKNKKWKNKKNVASFDKLRRKEEKLIAKEQKLRMKEEKLRMKEKARQEKGHHFHPRDSSASGWRERRAQRGGEYRERLHAAPHACGDVAHERRNRMPEHKLMARFVQHVTVPDGEVLAPNTRFIKTWRFRNEGEMAWPEGTALVFLAHGNSDRLGTMERVELSHPAQPGEEVEVSVEMTAPEKPGRYASFWKLAYPSGRKFGQRVGVKINVNTSTATATTPQQPAQAM